MICRTCGTEIADKAIICYRCGTPTTDPVRQPPPGASKWERPSRRPRTGRLPELVSLVLLVAVALYLGSGRAAQIPPAIAYTVAAATAALLAWRLLRRRRR